MAISASPGLVVTYLPVDTLVPNPSNARIHSKQQVRQIADSIGTFGFTNPVLINKRRKIIAGHGRVDAAKLLGIRDVPTIQLEHLSEDQIRAYIIADNKLAEKAGWSNAILAIELQHLMEMDIGLDVTITGFEMPEIDLILQEAAGEQDGDDFVEIEETDTPLTQTGDIWVLGKHRISCNNALLENSFTELMRDRRANMALADVPYNVRIDGHASGNGSIKHREFAMASGEMSDAEFTAFLKTALGLLVQFSVGASIHFIFMDWRHLGELLSAGRSVYGKPINLCVWVKQNGGMGSLYRSRHELVSVFRNGKGPHRNNVQLGRHGRNRTNVWEYPGINTLSRQSEEGNLLAMHPTVKPVALIADAILDCSARGDIVLDSFLGSGSTLIAAERTGRICYGIEIDPLYVDTAIRRWQRYTGESAVHATSKKRFADLARRKRSAR